MLELWILMDFNSTINYIQYALLSRVGKTSEQPCQDMMIFNIEDDNAEFKKSGGKLRLSGNI